MIRCRSKIKTINFFSENQSKHSFKVLIILMCILDKMRMYMIQECQMTGQIQKI